MFKQFLELAGQIFTLTRDTQSNKSSIREAREEIKDVRQEIKEVERDVKDLRQEINDLRREFRDLTRAVERLAYEIHRVSENDEKERRLLALQLENEMLKFERRLPPGRPGTEEQ